MTAEPDIERILVDERARRQGPKRFPAVSAMTRDFMALGEDHYQTAVPEIGVVFDIDRIRRERHELWGEFSVTCNLPGAFAVNGSLSIADLNLSSARARVERAKLCAGRANTGNGIDWTGLLEEFCQRVLEADRVGQPAVDLRDLPLPKGEADFEVDGFSTPRCHPAMIFGDGGSLKSYAALWYAGRLAQRGIRVAIFDWELSGEDHRVRLERLFGDAMPQILYVRCDRPLSSEVDRLRRLVRECKIQYPIFDSVAFACDGPPEAAEVAGRYFRAVRQIGGGSLHVAHINKSDNADQKPFGSTFWHNSARATWFVKRADESPDGSIVRLGLFNRKANLGPIRPPAAFTVAFTEGRTAFRRSDVADSPELSAGLSVRQKMAALLRRGSMAPERVAEEIDAELETVKRTARRYKNVFVMIPDGSIGLLDKAAS